MVRKPRTVHVAKVTNTVKGVTYTSYYLRRTFRQDGKVKHETVLEMHTVSGKDTFEPDRITLVLPVLHRGFHGGLLLISLFLREMETVVGQDECRASHVPNLKRACPLT
jgi:hypothetical protein